MKAKKSMSASARVMQAGSHLTVTQFIHIANLLHGGISYAGCSKGAIIKALLEGELNQKTYTAVELIAAIGAVEEEPDKAKLSRARRRRCDYEDLPTHESHGLIGISRIQGTADLHGSPIKSHGFIEIRINESRRSSGLGTEHYSDGDIVLQLRMSETQFAQMITTPNQGCGVPCTLTYRHTEGFKRLEDPPAEESLSSVTRRQFKEDIDDSMATMKAVRRRLDKKLEEGRISNKLREELREEIFDLLRLFEDSAPYVMERFEENCQQTVATAKTEVASYVALVAQQHGLQALRDGAELRPLIQEAE